MTDAGQSKPSSGESDSQEPSKSTDAGSYTPYWYGTAASAAESSKKPDQPKSEAEPDPQANELDSADLRNEQPAERMLSRRRLAQGMLAGSLSVAGLLWFGSRLIRDDPPVADGVPASSGSGEASILEPAPSQNSSRDGDSQDASVEDEVPFTFATPSWRDGDPIAERLTCDGENWSPKLSWTSVPDGTREYALIMEDLDAGGFVHWVVYGLPGSSRGLDENEEITSLQGPNDFGRIGYDGPCPPSGESHRYRFTLYALRRGLTLQSGLTAKELRSEMEGSVLGSVSFTGVYLDR